MEALRTAYGTTRVLVVDLADDEPAEVAGAVLTRAEVADLTLEEPDLEDIVRRIYRGETPP